MKRGKLIAIEGSDGAGKATQTKALIKKADKSKIKLVGISFPDYKTSTGGLIRDYLTGKFGDPTELPALISAASYAWNRREKAEWIEHHLANGVNVLCDRYIGSNWIHQAAKLETVAEKETFVDWNIRYENSMGIQMPNRTFALWLPRTEAVKAMGAQGKTQDGHESNNDYQSKVMSTFTWLCETQPTWEPINCMNRNKRKSENQITKEIWASLKEFLTLQK
jgi:dTMP kinase